MKVLSFKCLSPFFELCRDGQKPFDIRLWDGKDKRFRALAQLQDASGWWIELAHPSGEHFQRQLIGWRYLENLGKRDFIKPMWIIMFLGELK